MPTQFSTPNEVIQTKTADYTVVAGDSVVLCDTTSGAITVTLPTPVGAWNGYPYNSNVGEVRIVNTGSTGYMVNVTTAAGSLVGNATLGPGASGIFTSDGVSKWYQFTPIGSSYEVQVSISSADILAANSTPKTLVPAPGSGKVIVVEHILLKMVTTATAYANGGALEFRYTNASGAKVTADIAAGVVTAGAGTSYTSVAGVTTSLTNVANAAIVMDNATAAFITGTGTAVATVKFRVVTP